MRNVGPSDSGPKDLDSRRGESEYRTRSAVGAC
jgi:hypothetical protein